MELWRKRKERKKEKAHARECFVENGSKFLEELIAESNGITNPIRMFTSDQISKATNHFDPKCCLFEDVYFKWYKGVVIEGRTYAIKEFSELPYYNRECATRDIVVSARVSNHSGFLKLIGCCLEFPLPIAVFEDIEHGVLNDRGSVGSLLLPWNVRLKIAKEVAIAITYLHTAFPRIIIHRNINASSVLLDKNWTAKLTDFSLSVTLPEGETSTEDTVMGTLGYMDPAYAMRGIVTTYTDVYSFGIFMLVLLLGRPPVLEGSNGKWDPDSYIISYVENLLERGEVVVFGGDSKNDIKPTQMKMLLELALRCCDFRNEDGLKMIVVAKEIKLIESSPDC